MYKIIVQTEGITAGDNYLATVKTTKARYLWFIFITKKVEITSYFPNTKVIINL